LARNPCGRNTCPAHPSTDSQKKAAVKSSTPGRTSTPTGATVTWAGQGKPPRPLNLYGLRSVGVSSQQGAHTTCTQRVHTTCTHYVHTLRCTHYVHTQRAHTTTRTQRQLCSPYGQPYLLWTTRPRGRRGPSRYSLSGRCGTARASGRGHWLPIPAPAAYKYKHTGRVAP
jgi:hypothetical protein